MPQVIQDYTHSVQKHFLPFTEDMNRSAVKLYFRLHSTHWVRNALAGTGVEYAGMQVHRRPEDQNAAGKTAMSESMAGGTFIELTASIVSAYVSNNSVPTADLPALIGQVHSALTRVSSGHVKCRASRPSRRSRSRSRLRRITSSVSRTERNSSPSSATCARNTI